MQLLMQDFAMKRSTRPFPCTLRRMKNPTLRLSLGADWEIREDKRSEGRHSEEKEQKQWQAI